MKISLITVVFNRQDTIGEAIESVMRQTHADYEHIILDGASSDETLEVVRRYTHPKARIVSEPDEGIYDALNKGLELAAGEIIGIVHSDDFFAHASVLEKVVQAFADPEIDLVYGDLDYVTGHDTEVVVRHWRSGAFRPASLRWGWMPPHPTVFVRRQVIEALGGYDKSYQIAGDYDAILRWLSAGVKVAYIPEVLVKMRVGGESNRSLARILRKSWEDYRAVRSNAVGGLFSVVAKNLRKVPQLICRKESPARSGRHKTGQ
jgi:glycosyltransferase involved in cell wall biosynthesis